MKTLKTKKRGEITIHDQIEFFKTGDMSPTTAASMPDRIKEEIAFYERCIKRNEAALIDYQKTPGRSGRIIATETHIANYRAEIITLNEALKLF